MIWGVAVAISWSPPGGRGPGGAKTAWPSATTGSFAASAKDAGRNQCRQPLASPRTQVQRRFAAPSGGADVRGWPTALVEVLPALLGDADAAAAIALNGDARRL